MANHLTATMDVWVQMLKDNASLVTLLGSANKVYRHALPPIPSGGRTYSKAELAAFRPFCIAMREDHRFLADGAGGGYSMQQSGQLIAMIEWPIAAGDAKKTIELIDAADLAFDGVISDLLAMNGQATRLALQKIEVSGPGRTAPDDRASEGDFWRAHIVCDWGFSN